MTSHPPSSPTLSVISDNTNDGTAPPYKTSLALRQNNPQSHARQISVNSTFTDASGDLGASAAKGHDGASYAERTTVCESSASPTVPKDPKKAEAHQSVGEQHEKAPISEQADAVVAEKSGWWNRFKAGFMGNTRAARAAAQASALEEEKQRQLNIDPAPFRFKPHQMIDLVDPKSVEKLRDMGGVRGLLAGLGADGHRGLDIAGNELEDSPAGPDGEKVQRDLEAAEEVDHGMVDVVKATQEDRERVFGRNVLPERKSKSLLLLMWLALQDKILVEWRLVYMHSSTLYLHADTAHLAPI